MKKYLFLIFLCGCGPTIDTPMKTQSMKTNAEFSIEVVRVGVFEDSVAYHETRGIYIIKDNKTGVEYIGISGIGISERGSHRSGKTIMTDER